MIAVSSGHAADAADAARREQDGGAEFTSRLFSVSLVSEALLSEPASQSSGGFCSRRRGAEAASEFARNTSRSLGSLGFLSDFLLLLSLSLSLSILALFARA